MNYLVKRQAGNGKEREATSSVTPNITIWQTGTDCPAPRVTRQTVTHIIIIFICILIIINGRKFTTKRRTGIQKIIVQLSKLHIT